MWWVTLLVAHAEPTLVLVDEHTLDGTAIVERLDEAFVDVAPDHVTEIVVVDSRDTISLDEALPRADGLVLLPSADVASSGNLGPILGAAISWARATRRGSAIVVEPIAPPGADHAARQLEVRAGVDTIVDALATSAGGATRVPVGEAFADASLFTLVDAVGAPTAIGAWFASCLIVATATGRVPGHAALDGDPIPGRLLELCQSLAVDAALPPSIAWRPWVQPWSAAEAIGGSRAIGDTWLSPLVHVSSGLEALSDDLAIGRGDPDVRGRLDVISGQLIIGGTLGLGAGPAVPGGRATMRLVGGAYVQALRVELGPSSTTTLELSSGELRATELSIPYGLGAVTWPSVDPCDGRMSARRVSPSLTVTGCFELPDDAELDGDLEIASGGVLRLDAQGTVTIDGDVTARGIVVVEGLAPPGPVRLIVAHAIDWAPSEVDLPRGTRAHVEETSGGTVLWLDRPEAPAPEGPFAPPLLPPGEDTGCGCVAVGASASGWPCLALLGMIRRRRAPATVPARSP